MERADQEESFRGNRGGSEGPILRATAEVEKELAGVLTRLRGKLIGLKSDMKKDRLGRTKLDLWASANKVEPGDLAPLMNSCFLVGVGGLEMISVFKGKSTEARLENAKALLESLSGGTGGQELGLKQRELLEQAERAYRLLTAIAAGRGSDYFAVAQELGWPREIAEAVAFSIGNPKEMEVLQELKKAIPGEKTGDRVAVLRGLVVLAMREYDKVLDEKRQIDTALYRMGNSLRSISALCKNLGKGGVEGMDAELGLTAEQVTLFASCMFFKTTEREMEMIRSLVPGGNNKEKIAWLGEAETRAEKADRKMCGLPEETARGESLFRRQIGRGTDFLSSGIGSI